MQLWLNFINENGVAKRVLVTGESFVIGRTPDNDLQIALGNLSRQHAKIERFEDVYTISDCGSSNGSTLNGERVESPIELKNGDKVNLGDEVNLKIEIVSGQSERPKPSAVDDSDDDDDDDDSVSASASNSGGNNSVLIGCLILVPVLGLLALLIVGGIFLISNNTNKPEVVQNRDVPVNKDDDEDLPTNTKEPTPDKTETPTTSPTTTTPSGGNSTPQPTETVVTTPKPSGDTEKIELNSSACLRRIAQNDPKAFLTTKQISILNGKINQIKNSSALAENLRNAKKNASQLETMARSKNLKPQFLAVAALTKLGSQRGDVVTTAQGMLETLDNLSIPIGSELANENLLILAAYEQGVAGKNLEMRDMLARECLPEKNPGVTSREIRTIWFLKDKGKISDSQFDFALHFLAIGTIAQNPKDFGIQADAVMLN